MQAATLMLLLTACFSGLSLAAETTQITRSATLQPAFSDLSITDKLQFSPVIEFLPQHKARLTDQASAGANLQYRYAGDTPPVSFSLFDAWAELSGDLDHDGYYHRIKVSFDADVDSALETVYVKLFLSHQGAAWRQYASSDLFEIRYDEAADRYEVITELVEGYQPGYYDVLLELHSLHHEGIVASRIIDMDNAGFVLALEDMEHDESFAEVYYYSEYGVSGSFSWAGIILLGILLLIKLQFFPTRQKTKSPEAALYQRGEDKEQPQDLRTKSPD